MCTYLTVDQRARALKEAPRTKKVTRSDGDLVCKARGCCDCFGFLFGQYAACRNIDPVDYFHRYGVTLSGFRQYCCSKPEFRAEFGDEDDQIACVQFRERFSIPLSVCPDYVHALEVLQKAYGVKWRVIDEEVWLLGYPLLSNGEAPSFLDLFAGWTVLSPSQRIKYIAFSDVLVGKKSAEKRPPSVLCPTCYPQALTCTGVEQWCAGVNGQQGKVAEIWPSGSR